MARKRAAASALSVIIASAASSIRGGLYDPEIETVVQVDVLLPLLGEALVFVNRKSSVLKGTPNMCTNTRCRAKTHIYPPPSLRPPVRSRRPRHSTQHDPHPMRRSPLHDPSLRARPQLLPAITQPAPPPAKIYLKLDHSIKSVLANRLNGIWLCRRPEHGELGCPGEGRAYR